MKRKKSFANKKINFNLREVYIRNFFLEILVLIFFYDNKIALYLVSFPQFKQIS